MLRNWKQQNFVQCQKDLQTHVYVAGNSSMEGYC